MFWFRRVVVLAAFALVVGLVVVVVKTVVPGISSALTGSDEPVTVVDSPTTPPTTDGPIGDCVPGAVVAQVVPSATTVAWGKDVTFHITLRNQGGGSCVVDGGTDATSVVVRTAAQQQAADAQAADDAQAGAAAASTATSTGTPGTGTSTGKTTDKTTSGKAPKTKTPTKGSSTDAAAPGYVWSSGDCSSDQRLLLLGVGDEDVHSLVWHRERSAAGCTKGLGDVGAGTYSVTVTVLGTTSEPVTVTLAPRPEPSSAATSDAASDATSPASTKGTGSTATKGASDEATKKSTPPTTTGPSTGSTSTATKSPSKD